jgi:hypothetical protein
VLSGLPTDSMENHVIESGVADHCRMLSGVEGNAKDTEMQDIYFRKTKLSDQKWEEFNLHFQNSITRNIPFPQLLDANSLAEAITHTYQASIDEFMPLKKRKNNLVGKPDDRPWITADLKASISHMFELLRISKESRSPHDYEIYKKYLNKLTHLKEKAKNKYYRDKSELYGNDKSKAWQLVNDIANYKKKKKTPVKHKVVFECWFGFV